MTPPLRIGKLPPPSARDPNCTGSSLKNLIPASLNPTLDKNVWPPSRDARNRGAHSKFSRFSRRSYHNTPTIPSRLTATTGWKSSGPLFPPRSRSSFILVARDHVLPRSLEVENNISQRPDRESGQAI